MQRFKVELDEEFANKMQRAMTRALLVVGREQRHHSLCVRAPTMIKHYKEEWPLVWHAQWASFDDERKAIFKRHFDEIVKVDSFGDDDIKNNYESAKRRSVILLADLSENYLEALLELLISKGLPGNAEVIALTGLKKANLSDTQSIRRAIRHWERTKFPDVPKRTDRILEMMNTFMPFSWASIDSKCHLDSIFEHRNRLTHEIVQLGDLNDERFHPQDADSISLSEVDEFFVAVADFIGATLESFKSLHMDWAADISH